MSTADDRQAAATGSTCSDPLGRACLPLLSSRRSSSSSSTRSTPVGLLVSWNGFGFTSYEAVWQDETIKDALWMSIRVAVLSAVVSTVIGTLAGVALARRPGKWTYFFLALVALVLVTPEIVDAVALLPWFVWLGGDAGIDSVQQRLDTPHHWYRHLCHRRCGAHHSRAHERARRVT